eukprot:TRINITY_DN10348_c0_g1_i3.p2 TRINITY_DN10348_c0_g1~~TRINITY_DN10348_c0_g1_i3.p2  ORF type:complete len:175 (-),score=2.91 TRINITY_DN10348_c0_g1_i3:1253-1777(-)
MTQRIIQGRRWKFLFTATTVFCYKHCCHPRRQVPIDVTVKEPCSWIVSHEPYGRPAINGEIKGIKLWRIHKVKLLRIFHRIEDSQSSAHNEEIVAVQMEGMALSSHNSGPLHHQLHGRVIFQKLNSGALLHIPRHQALVRKVKHERREVREVGRVDAWDIEVMGFQDGDRRQKE